MNQGCSWVGLQGMRLAPTFLVAAVAASLCAQGTTSLERFPLKHVTGQQAYEKVRMNKLEGIDYITFDPSQNLLVVRGTPAGIKLVRELVAKIDVP